MHGELRLKIDILRFTTFKMKLSAYPHTSTVHSCADTIHVLCSNVLTNDSTHKLEVTQVIWVAV